MRSTITTILVLVLIVLFGWTVYKFVAKRADEIRNAPDTAPALVSGTVTPVPASKPTATPAAPAIATTVPAATATPKTGSKTTVVSKNGLPKTGPEDLGLVAGMLAGGAGLFAAIRNSRSKRALAKSYRSQVVL